MVRYYVKRSSRKVNSPSKLKQAAELVANGWAMRAAARQANINRQTLWKFLKKKKDQNVDLKEADINEFRLSYATRQIFTTDQEKAIVSYCILVAKMGYGLTVKTVRELAYQLAVRNQIEIPEKWQREKHAGIDWFQGFKKRHSKELSIRTPESCSIARAMAFNKHNVTGFFDKLDEVLSRHPSFQNGSRVYNLDETSASTVQADRKLVSPKGVKQVYQIKTAERGTSVTTTVIIGANGSSLPPVMIFSRKIFKPHMLINAYPGTKGLANEKATTQKRHSMK